MTLAYALLVLNIYAAVKRLPNRCGCGGLVAYKYVDAGYVGACVDCDRVVMVGGR